ncbi:DNA repair exonuclease SbcCD ATPase subunit [Desulfosalsimonas propionicica]|uniref:DNA repair exonuclease SbcCD ATPase subunit n=1 Tax=Desulfosalsimonas propionicica TaxID=332175 RepID=A0A7W0C7M8_9BACT|nr:DUF4124 domain-containing protein [Desulfosalsimonas propionicica]MBA2880644.1 DNA repair exonuclease SbcCD ATPase subunit [Desulfosalsimonas propionicica]
MKIFVYIILVMPVLFLWSLPVEAEYYQYKDENGKLHYTDDISQIPEHSSETLKKFDSVSSRPESTRPESRKRNQSQNRHASGETWDGKLENTAKQLDSEREKLQQTYQELQNEKQELKQKSTDDMTKSERNAHARKIRELNSRIRRYNEQEKAFSEKIKRLNGRINDKEDNAGQR